jgi:hypothetical protein
MQVIVLGGLSNGEIFEANEVKMVRSYIEAHHWANMRRFSHRSLRFQRRLVRAAYKLWE